MTISWKQAQKEKEGSKLQKWNEKDNIYSIQHQNDQRNHKRVKVKKRGIRKGNPVSNSHRRQLLDKVRGMKLKLEEDG